MTSEQRAIIRESADAHPDDDGLRALADSEPTVAELLPQASATHGVFWVGTDNRRKRACLGVGGEGVGLVFDVQAGAGLWWPCRVIPSDFGCPAAVLEVSR